MAEQNTADDTKLAEDGDKAEVKTTDLDTKDSASNSEQVLDEDKKKDDDNKDSSAAGQIKKVQGYLDRGETVPKDLQWALKHIQGDDIKKEDEKEAPPLDEFDKMDAWAASRQHDKNKEYLASLPADLKNDLTRETNELKKELGVGIDKALARTLRTNKEKIEKDLQSAKARKSGAVLPGAGKAPKGSTIGLAEFSQLPTKERADLWAQKEAGEITIE